MWYAILEFDGEPITDVTTANQALSTLFDDDAAADAKEDLGAGAWHVGLPDAEEIGLEGGADLDLTSGGFRIQVSAP